MNYTLAELQGFETQSSRLRLRIQNYTLAELQGSETAS